MKFTYLKTLGEVSLTIEDIEKLVADFLSKEKKGKLINFQVVDQTFVASFLLTSKKQVSEKRETNNKSWVGLYPSVRTIITSYKSKKKTSITFEELYDELVKLKDDKGNLLFVRGDQKLEKWRVKQYLAPSQLFQLDMKGVKRTTDHQGIQWKL
jgi:hypothetical protein